MQEALNHSMSIVLARSTWIEWLTQKTSYTFSDTVNKKRKTVIIKEGTVELILILDSHSSFILLPSTWKGLISTV